MIRIGMISRSFKDLLYVADLLLDFPADFFVGAFIFKLRVVRGVPYLFFHGAFDLMAFPPTVSFVFFI